MRATDRPATRVASCCTTRCLAKSRHAGCQRRTARMGQRRTPTGSRCRSSCVALLNSLFVNSVAFIAEDTDGLERACLGTPIATVGWTVNSMAEKQSGARSQTSIRKMLELGDEFLGLELAHKLRACYHGDASLGTGVAARTSNRKRIPSECCDTPFTSTPICFSKSSSQSLRATRARSFKSLLFAMRELILRRAMLSFACNAWF